MPAEHEDKPKSIEELLESRDSFESIWNYGIDTLDPKNLTKKDRIYRTLNTIKKGKSEEEAFQALLDGRGADDKVVIDDLLATHDALILRLAALRKAGKLSDANYTSMEADYKVIKKYLEAQNQKGSGQQISLSEMSVIDRVIQFEEILKKLANKDKFDDIFNSDYRQLIREAAKIGAYYQDKQPLQHLIERIKKYHPEDEGVFNQHLDQVGSPDVETDYFANMPESDNGRISREDVVAELTHVLEQLSKDGFRPEYVTFFGSLNRGSARSTETDPNDPSDVDLFMIVPDENFAFLDQSVVKKLGRRQEFYGQNQKVVSYEYFVESKTGKLAKSECFVITRSEFDKMNSDPGFYQANPSRKKFVQDALYGRVISGHLPLSVAV